MKALAREGLFFPPDPASGDFCTIGGMIANNSSGARSVKVWRHNRLPGASRRLLFREQGLSSQKNMTSHFPASMVGKPEQSTDDSSKARLPHKKSDFTL